jgi:hypothetical protein
VRLEGLRQNHLLTQQAKNTYNPHCCCWQTRMERRAPMEESLAFTASARHSRCSSYIICQTQLGGRPRGNCSADWLLLSSKVCLNNFSLFFWCFPPLFVSPSEAAPLKHFFLFATERQEDEGGKAKSLSLL